MDRRAFLKGMGASALAACKPETSSDTLVEPGPTGADAIEHIVFVMMENRSFDHYLGALTLKEGRDDVDGLTKGLVNEGRDGTPYRPFRLEQGPDFCPPDPPHGWSTSRVQFEEGTNNGFAKAYQDRWGSSANPGLPLGYLERDQLPVMYAMSDAYVTCDRWFCSQMSSTWPNRLYAHGAECQGAFGNDLPESETGFFTFPTLWDRLDDADIPWKYYFSDAPFLALFGNRWDVDEKTGWIDDFFVDVANGVLPPVCQVEPAFTFNDDHPPHHPLLGQMFLASIHNALATSSLWRKTLLVITYDEHGGFYDHVPPPKAADVRADQGFDQLGFRVPSLLVGPWVQPGLVDNTVYDHSSWIAHVLRKFDLEPLTDRDEAANDFSHVFTDTFQEPAELPMIELSAEAVQAQCSARRSAHQPELEDLLDRLDWGPRHDRRHELERVAVDAIERAEALGVCLLR